ncbi:MAG: hypothetical protein M3018_14510 [Actinomycetota bacterium]|nr:hypothetical protein [Actinomycetota bacterium]
MKRLLIVLCVATSALLVSGAVALAGDSGSSGGEVHVYGVSTTGGNASQIIITGAIAARGETRNVSENIGMVTTPNGTFKVNLRELNHASGTGGVNQKTCSGAFTATAPITLFDGTGAYKNIKGTIKLTATFAAIFSKTDTGACNAGPTANPRTALSFFQGQGKVSF